uniref:Uncharacterized protein n=1 Tax=Globodera rostochiensis TaxID=31243 RepID=A0A914GRV2_GLORO
MKVIDESEEPITSALETVLLNLGNLSVDAVQPLKKSERIEQSFGKDKLAEMQRRSDGQLSKLPLRYIPYKVPRRLLLALQRHRLIERQRNSQSAAVPLSDGNSLPNARLVGCDFDGRSLPSVSNETGRQAMMGKERSSPSPPSLAFTSYRIVPPMRPRPCWLQHTQTPAECPTAEMGSASESDTTTSTGRDDDGQQQTRDFGLAELTDYFQHFVCLCSPRMSDQAQSMYA